MSYYQLQHIFRVAVGVRLQLQRAEELSFCCDRSGKRWYTSCVGFLRILLCCVGVNFLMDRPSHNLIFSEKDVSGDLPWL